MECDSAIKCNEIMPFVATWRNLETIILSEVSQTKTSIMWYHSYVESNFKKTGKPGMLPSSMGSQRVGHN